MRFHVAPAVRSAALRNRCLSFAETCSIGLRSGLQGGRNSRWAPACLIALLTALPLWRERLSITTDTVHGGRVDAGIREVFGGVYASMGWDRLFGARRMSANRIIKELTLARLAQPLSKRATVRELDTHGGLSLNLDYVYRSMDLIDGAVTGGIRRRSFEAARTLLPDPVSVIFYDTTTLYFESERGDGLREKGYSKDGKPHRVQTVFALLVTPEGLPVGYELFPGDVYEGNTLTGALGRLERQYPGTAFTVVADAAMISAANEAALRARGTPYILGARLRSRPAAERRLILDREGHTALGDGPEDGSYRVIETGGSRLVVTHSPRRARKESRDRDRRIGKLRARLERNGSAAGQAGRGTARFLDFPGGRVTLNEDKIKEAARWDGLRGIIAWGLDDTGPLELLRIYRQRAGIEACFRANKHDLRIRPVFHWKPDRIRAHIAICYMAYVCLQHLRHRLAARGHPMSPDRIRRALGGLHYTILNRKYGPGKFGLPSQASADAREILRTLGMRWHTAAFIIEPPDGNTARRAA